MTSRSAVPSLRQTPKLGVARRPHLKPQRPKGGSDSRTFRDLHETIETFVREKRLR
jgi:hypothetical protein